MEGRNVSIQIHNPIRAGARPHGGISAVVVVLVIVVMTATMSPDRIAATAALVTAAAAAVTRTNRAEVGQPSVCGSAGVNAS